MNTRTIKELVKTNPEMVNTTLLFHYVINGVMESSNFVELSKKHMDKNGSMSFIVKDIFDGKLRNKHLLIIVSANYDEDNVTVKLFDTINDRDICYGSVIFKPHEMLTDHDIIVDLYKQLSELKCVRQAEKNYASMSECLATGDKLSSFMSINGWSRFDPDNCHPYRFEKDDTIVYIDFNDNTIYMFITKNVDRTGCNWYRYNVETKVALSSCCEYVLRTINKISKLISLFSDSLLKS